MTNDTQSLRDDTIDDLASVIGDAYHDTLDMEGPNFKTMAAEVFEFIFGEGAHIPSHTGQVRMAAIQYITACDTYNNCVRDEDREALGPLVKQASERFTQVVGFGFAADADDVARLLIDLTTPNPELMFAYQAMTAVPMNEADARTIVVSARVHDLFLKAAGVTD